MSSNNEGHEPTMEEILASIRRIIDTGESQAKAREPRPEEAAPPRADTAVPPLAANDAGDDRARVPQAVLANSPRTPQRENAAGDAPGDIAAAVDAYLEQERTVKPAVPARPAEDKAPEPDMTAFTLEAAREPDISEVEAALRAEFNPVDRDVLAAERQAKYDARFTAEDDGTFRQVGSLLRGKVGETAPQPESQQVAEKNGGALVSDAVSQSVSHSFASLSEMLLDKHGRDLDMMAEDMLRPMLQEWLDNNLPSLVERLVRSEIERIARGEPRTA